jgi:hypothetical protein
MTRLTLVFLIAALVVPGAASAAASNRDALAIEKYYSSYDTVEPVEVAASKPDPVATGHDGPSWFGALGIGFGLIVIAGGLGVYAGRTLRPRHLRA